MLSAFMLIVCGGLVPVQEALFGIRVVDAESQRGIPLVELTTVDDVTWITDSDGWVAIDEPQLEGQFVFLRIDAPGYDVPKDGFGIAGVRFDVRAGERQTIELMRQQPAERLYRITGRDQFRDSIRLGLRPADEQPTGNGDVVGQDSVQTAIYGGQLHWFWGDTNRLSYPLGLYRTAGAVSASPLTTSVDAASPIALRYVTDDSGFARRMVDVPDRDGVVWIHGVCTVQDADGHDRMVAQYSRREGLSAPMEQGLVIWNDAREMFEVLQVVPLDESWRLLSDHPIRMTDDGTDYLCFGNPFPVVRVPATLDAIQDRHAYQAWSCRPDSGQPNMSEGQLEASQPERDASGTLAWRWRSGPPVIQVDEQRWVKQKVVTTDECRFLPREWLAGTTETDAGDAQPEKTPGADASGSGSGTEVDAVDARRVVQMHSGTVRFNAARKRWVMVAIEHAWEQNSPSFLGEVFYAEADSPQGPFARALKIATHPGQSFYNPCHHDVFDQDGGRVIFFEGTYCNTFTKSAPKSRYNYNQLMYRLDLSHPQIEAVFGPAGR